MCGLTIMVSRRLAECEANRPRHYDLSNFPTVHCNVYMVGCNVRHEVQCTVGVLYRGYRGTVDILLLAGYWGTVGVLILG